MGVVSCNRCVSSMMTELITCCVSDRKGYPCPMMDSSSSSSNEAMSSSSRLMIGMLGVGPDGVGGGDAVGLVGYDDVLGSCWWFL